MNTAGRHDICSLEGLAGISTPKTDVGFFAGSAYNSLCVGAGFVRVTCAPLKTSAPALACCG